jgi:hypothetical protein
MRNVMSAMPLVVSRGRENRQLLDGFLLPGQRGLTGS